MTSNNSVHTWRSCVPDDQLLVIADAAKDVLMFGVPRHILRCDGCSGWDSIVSNIVLQCSCVKQALYRELVLTALMCSFLTQHGAQRSCMMQEGQLSMAAGHTLQGVLLST